MQLEIFKITMFYQLSVESNVGRSKSKEYVLVCDSGSTFQFLIGGYLSIEPLCFM